ncbi:uncharacterized protein [Brachyistius frenatus]|uniref:uncharacterized protein n=1 Tax=Brachyistius frenatus TaxID=100188 RepID=UPI0037E79854
MDPDSFMGCLFERTPIRLSLPPFLSLSVSPRSRKSVPPSRPDLWPLEVSGAEGRHLSSVPHIVLTKCLPGSPTTSKDPVRDLARLEESPSRDWSGHHTAYRNLTSGERHSEGFERLPHWEQEFKQEVALLLTELEMRVVSPLEAQELRRTAGEVLQTLIISPQTKEVSEVQLSERPVLVLFREEKTVREAYKLLYSFLESSKPVPKPRLKSSHHPGLRGSLLEALRRGMETGDYMLTLEHTDEVKMTPEAQQSLVNRTPESSGSTSCVDSLASQRRASQDVRRSTYRRLDSLEETIRELENTLIEIGGHPTAEELYTETTTMSTPVRTTGSPTSETKRPPVPPKPTSLSTASTQVQCFHLLCRLLL